MPAACPLTSKNITRFFILFVALIAALSTLFLFRRQSSDGIATYDITRDAAFIESAFNKDMFWLSDSPSFNVRRVTHDLSSSQYDDSKKNTLTIKVMMDQGKQAGFIAYYLQNFYIGHIYLVWVDPAYRGKHYGEKLVKYAINDLFARGSKRVELPTRIINKPARRIYEGVGMREIKQEDGFIYYAIDKK
jgi:ribosomal protein S18 acetylase RimI-like enzyme